MSGYRPGYIEGKVKAGFYIDPEVQQALKIRAAQTGESMSEIAERAIKKELGIVTGTTFRAAYWTDGTAEVLLTLPEHADLSDDELLAEARAEAERQGMDLSRGDIVVGEWTD